MLYPAELGARRSAIQVTGARPVKRNCAQPLRAANFCAMDGQRAGGERSTREVEAAHPGGFAALDCAARDFTQELAIGGVRDRKARLAPEGTEARVIQDAHDFVVPVLDPDDTERCSCDLNHSFDDDLHLTSLAAPTRWTN